MWRVDDLATKEFMLRFHRLRREQGLPAVRALREAQAELRAAAGGRFAHPSAWAGWVAWGPAD
jgi:CHAT domain-containing protein